MSGEHWLLISFACGAVFGGALTLAMLVTIVQEFHERLYPVGGGPEA